MLRFLHKKQLGKLIHFLLKCLVNIEKRNKCNKIKNYSYKENVTLYTMHVY